MKAPTSIFLGVQVDLFMAERGSIILCYELGVLLLGGLSYYIFKGGPPIPNIVNVTAVCSANGLRFIRFCIIPMDKIVRLVSQ